MKKKRMLHVVATVSLTALIVFIQACSATPQPSADANIVGTVGEQSFEVGTVVIVSNGTEHEPGVHHLHSVIYANGGLMSGTGIPFESWLDNNLSALPEIQYTGNLQVVVDGEFGQVVTQMHHNQMYWDMLRLIGIPAENFSGGVANVSPPNEAGTFLLYVDVNWSGEGDEFTLLRYVFKVVR